jgi:hypothetical protein
MPLVAQALRWFVIRQLPNSTRPCGATFRSTYMWCAGLTLPATHRFINLALRVIARVAVALLDLADQLVALTVQRVELVIGEAPPTALSPCP